MSAKEAKAKAQRAYQKRWHTSATKWHGATNSEPNWPQALPEHFHLHIHLDVMMPDGWTPPKQVEGDDYED